MNRLRNIYRWLREYFGRGRQGEFFYSIEDNPRNQILGPYDYYNLGYVYRIKKTRTIFGKREIRRIHVWEETAREEEGEELPDGWAVEAKLDAICTDLNTPGIKFWVEAEDWKNSKDPDTKYSLVRIFYYAYSEWEDVVKRIDVAQKIFSWDAYGTDKDTDWWEVSFNVSRFIDRVCTLFPELPKVRYMFGSYRDY